MNYSKLLAKSIRTSYHSYSSKFGRSMNKFRMLLLDQYGNKYKEEVNFLLTYSYIIKSKGNNVLTYSRDKNSFTGTRLSYSRMMKLVDMMKEDAYIDHLKGYGYYDKAIETLTEYQPSIIILQDKLLCMIEGKDSRVRGRLKKSELVTIRSTGKNTSSIDWEEKRRMEDYMLEYAELLNSKNITVEIDGERLPITDVTYKRSFLDDLDHGGRYYDVNGFMSTLPKPVRKTLEIDGDPVCELDYKNLHPAILYDIAEIDEQLPDMYDIDPAHLLKLLEVDGDKIDYYREVTGDLDYNPVRNLIKVCLLVMINSDDRRKATMAIYGKFNKEKNQLWKKWEDGDIDSLKFYGIDDLRSAVSLFNELEILHEPIAGRFYTKAGNWLQGIDSKIASYVIEYFHRHDQVVLSMHDSFICKKEQEQKLEEIMIEAYEVVVGSSAHCLVKKEY